MLFFTTPPRCNSCRKEPEAGVELNRCARCKCARYCNKECQTADWREHKKYCKRLVRVTSANAEAYVLSKQTVNPEASSVYREAWAAATSPRARNFLKLAVAMANDLVKACEMDHLPTEASESGWGLRGDPKSPKYARLLTAYQKALKYTDLGAQQLMECLLARPHAGQALTTALQEAKFVQTEQDDYEYSKRLIDGYSALVNGLVVVSEVDNFQFS